MQYYEILFFPQPQSCMSWTINFKSVVITTANSMQTTAQAKQQSQRTFLENPTDKPLRHALHSWWILNSTELIQKSHPQSHPTPPIHREKHHNIILLTSQNFSQTFSTWPSNLHAGRAGGSICLTRWVRCQRKWSGHYQS